MGLGAFRGVGRKHSVPVVECTADGQSLRREHEEEVSIMLVCSQGAIYLSS